MWVHNGILQLGGDKMSKSLGNIAAIREVLDQWGRETALVFFLGGHWRKPIEFSDGRWTGGRAGRGIPQRLRARVSGEATGRVAAALDDDFNTPEALALMHGWRDHELLRRGLAVFGLESLGALDVAPPEIVALAEQRVRPVRAATSSRPTGYAPRSRRRAGRCATRPAATRSSQAMTTDLVYGRRAVREVCAAGVR